jgi:hypothetical protein
MTEELAHRDDIDAALQQSTGKGVAKHMPVRMWDAGLDESIPDRLETLRTSDGCTADHRHEGTHRAIR